MARFLCPTCGADVPFRSTDAVTTTCPSCGVLLVRKDLTLESLGKLATLPEDISPLQIGTVGKLRGDQWSPRWKGKSFSILGRVRVDWEQGSWNEWYVRFDDGTPGWVGEAQGHWSIMTEVPVSSVNAGSLLSPAVLLPGNSAFIGNTQYEVEDARDAWVRGIQGELPKLIQPGKKYFSIDLSTLDGKGTATLALHPEGRAEAYAGEWGAFADFGFAGLRELHGW